MPLTKQEQSLYGSLLRDVSRTFYLTLRHLPQEIRPQIALAYLLARATDTIADTKILPREQRLGRLQTLRAQFAEATPNLSAAVEIDWAEWIAPQTDATEQTLLKRMSEILSLLKTCSEDDQKRIGKLLHTIIGGQIFDLEFFPPDIHGGLVTLRSQHEMDHYTYMVAGCVGEFWTDMCAAHLPPLEHWKTGAVNRLAVNFGKGLQLVNILRDFPRDLRLGRCYFPANDVASVYLKPRDLLDKAATFQFRPLHNKYINVASGYLNDGWAYTLQIPPVLWKLRFACALPILIGVRTLSQLRKSPHILNPEEPIKLSRSEVRWLFWRAFIASRNNTKLDIIYRRACI